MKSHLREEYKEYKLYKEKLVDEAAFGWVKENVVLINEQIDRNTVKRIINAITKFDNTFGPFKTKIPTLATQIDTAEDNLQKVITGRINDKKASDMLKRMSYLYNAFSRFFNSDLPVLLSSHLFATPQKHSDVRLDVLQPKEGEKYDPTAIRDAFRYALTPSKDEQKLINTIYRKRAVPLIDANSISSQLLGLSFNELKNLTEIGKVPMVVTAEEAVTPIVSSSPPSTPMAPPSQTTPPPMSKGTSTTGTNIPTNMEMVDRTQKKA